ncbi:3-dehydroquinate synthase [Glaciecola punicea ACAM 611]|jgi:3-dehydroquinate synthase|uniref:3-dehydroquinate synthase n=1 Tax=Glaciecola punicea ACAM 611 TaxID=1121923 RepID=H5TF10_9ALTE|nr:3-dehydroquinate synthase [Glaciecola punicea]OFA32728.1 3-dehydroquinate synthase [Glaciecola punicea]GAB56937.1 3-dehydroquinate synthase [Glaciecola punicea ACAM 611]
MPSILVDLGERSYPIAIQAGSLQNAGFLLDAISGKQVVIITNDVVAPLYLKTLMNTLSGANKNITHIILADGEATKTLASFELIMTHLLQDRISRDACIIALGGGVIGDLSGFVAACYQRGIDFIQIPTTLLSQVDSSVGGKTAVNHPLGKNMIGAFYQPKAVVIDPTTLQSLPQKEFAAGMAEVIKYGIIYDSTFFKWLNTHKADIKQQEPKALSTMIARCCQIKADIVNQDEKEHGIRALLNLGHTFGHAIEAQMGYGNWLHGEAVAAGTILACKLSAMRNQMLRSELRQVSNILGYFDLPLTGPANMSAQDYITHMQRDKKVLSGTMRFILPIGIGNAQVVSDVTQAQLSELLN